MLKLYGTSKSRSARSLWAVEELGLKYEHIPTPISQAKSSDHLRINPNGHIPAIDDDGSIIWESMAINVYLVCGMPLRSDSVPLLDERLLEALAPH
jgi:glutathione S-transferase